MSIALPFPARSRDARPLARSPALVLGVLFAVLATAALAAATVGAAGIPPGRLAAALGLIQGDPAVAAHDELVVWSIRLPRIAMAVMVGALLAAGGAMMQGLFRNPLADPGLVGVSSGAALAAAATIVLSGKLLPDLPPVALPLAAFVGALVVTAVLYRIATRGGRTSIAMLLLGGLAIGALAGALTGLLVFIADDRQLRDLTFWSLGSLAGATWAKVATLVPFLLAVVVATPLIARDLDRLALGEAEAYHLGTAVERLKRIAIVLVSAAVGAAVAVSGVIGFVGIIVPHLLRLVIGPGHRLLVPASLLLGPVLMLIADTLARVVVAPAELPIGILTAVLGAPVFLGLLLKQRALAGL
ncbi:FecCD family ABC transporter permease [Blastochloris viridis]|uniref:Hemin ABC transporter n=1 Tax=Blastochloris viridis TaxID=1079 RepID=A0A0H5BNB7_BLAVI|nr:iron chelate uptake ABC transporter family permease subunit [Blastochloris viridis]ALK08948.1 Hemin transport system permease protein HmuU [Blastochloris viridis]BAR97653.1 hemin ABC transporter [Blastochloris viridis]CUU41609.1 Vitamin B12 import system permease protein BtuC [Blastochloris viridis]